MQAVTAQDVKNATFKIRRLKAGYDMDEVDTLLDRVVVTLLGVQEQVVRVMQENLELREQLNQSGKTCDESVAKFMKQTQEKGL